MNNKQIDKYIIKPNELRLKRYKEHFENKNKKCLLTKRVFGRDKHNNLIIIKELNSSNEGYFLRYDINYRHNHSNYAKKIKNGGMYHCWQKESFILKKYIRIPRKKKKLIDDIKCSKKQYHVRIYKQPRFLNDNY